MSRRLQALLLLLLGGAVLRASGGSMYLRYVKPGLRPLLLLAGAALVVTAVVCLWHEFSGQIRDEHPSEPGHDVPGHDHTRGSRAAWLLALPVLGMLLIQPPALGSYAAAHDGSVVQVLTVIKPLPAGSPVPMKVFEYAGRAAYAHGQGLAGREVALTGFVYADAGRYYLARMVLTCCAADAGPVKVGLAGQVPAGMKPDTWVRVTGTYDPKSILDRINGARIPYLDVSTVRTVVAPKDPYE